MPTAITAAAIRADLPVAQLPQTIVWHAQATSTMDLARAALVTASDTDLPLLVGADGQTAGRGRRGRVWTAPPSSALLMSLALRPHWLAPAEAGVLVWLMGVALCEAISSTTGLEPRLKWPNDILIGGHKVAGVLLEASSTSNQLEHVIIGCGINVSASPPADLVRYPATHLDAHAATPTERLTLLRAVLVRLDTWYSRLATDFAATRPALFAAWHALLDTIGTPIHVETAQGTLHGIAEAVEPDGTLRLRAADGQLHLITSGDVFG